MMIKRYITGAVVALIVLMAVKSVVLTQPVQELREEFHQTYPLSANGRVSLENINGAVHIATWDRNEIKVDAVKTARTQERLNESKINIVSNPDSIQIETEYPRWTDDWDSKNPDRRHENPASVEYTLTIPRNASLQSIELINGALDIKDVAGRVKASTINGRLRAHGLSNEARLSTINGSLEATFDRLTDAQSIVLNSVNGNVTLTIPSDSSVTLKANTVHGAINNDFGLPVRRGEYVGRDLSGMLGQGTTRIKLGNVNGQITIRRASDGRTQAAVTNLLQDTGKNDHDVDPDVDGDDHDAIVDSQEIAREAREAAREAVREAADVTREVQREAQRTARESQREAQRTARDMQREVSRAMRDAQRDIERNRDEIEDAARMAAEMQIRENDTTGLRLVERESKTFPTSGVPRVNVETFDGSITVHTWNKPEVTFTAIKRARDAQAMSGIRLRSEQRGGEIILKAEFDKPSERQYGTGAVVQFDVYVPNSTNLRASSGDGRLLIEGINGEVDLNTGDGSVDVIGGRGRLHVNTGDGRIRITNYDGNAEAQTGDGRITLAGRFTQLNARTGDGSISLALPADFNATIETNAESVVNDGLAITEETDSSKRVRRWKVGRGGNLFTLRTGDGRILLHRADSTLAGQ